MLTIPQTAADLLVKHVGEFDDEFAQAERHVLTGQPLLAEVSGIDQLPQPLDALDVTFMMMAL